MKRTIAPVAVILLTASLACRGAAEPPVEKRIVFLGDSITQAGRYIEIIDAALLAQQPDVKRTIIPLGLASETVSGLSEPGHAAGKFPRPDLHERLDRILTRARPDLVIACYGMNDGIYHPLDKQRLQAFQEGIQRLRDKAGAAGARVIHVTPPVFDPLPIKERVLPAGLAVYEKPFAGYNQVLDAYAQWLLDMRAQKQWDVIDLHGPMNRALADKRQSDPQFTFARDGVHPSPEGQLLIARVVLDAWGLKIKPDGSPDHVHGAAILQAIQKKHALLRPAWLSHVGHKRPGIAPGLPIEQAEQQAALLDAEARRLAKSS